MAVPPAPTQASAMGPWLLALFLPTAWVPACRAQPVLTQPASIAVLPGQTVKLACALNSKYNIREFGVAWYQQRPGQSPRYLLYYNSETDQHKPAGVPARFSATKNPANNACVLTIAGVQADDDADYYCSVQYPVVYL
ncbi:pre-B lymphocyte protein 3-like [Pelodiscus sinensis]|uniref:pre-B lymphocyte protein 3-like n=1 Tax=Pelodiscus sinensis TaxID=13735 RepID=UPI003F6B9410